MAIFAEGIESLKLACSLVLLVPALGVVLLGRRRPLLVATWITVVAIVAWLGFVGWWAPRASGPMHIGVGIALVGMAMLAHRRHALDADLAVTALAALLAAWTWVPCVGSELGDILNNARRDPWSELVPTVLYFVGLFLPLIAVGALAVAIPGLGQALDRPRFRMAGLGVFALVGALVGGTLFDDLAGELARRSSF